MNCKIISFWNGSTSVRCVQKHNHRMLSGSFMRQSSQQLGNVPQKETEALIVRFALKWRKEKQRARLRTQLWNNVGILFSALSTFNNACTGHAHYIFSRLTHQANIAVMKLVCPGTIVSGCASPTFSVRLVKKKLVCNALQAFVCDLSMCFRSWKTKKVMHTFSYEFCEFPEPTPF